MKIIKLLVKTFLPDLKIKILLDKNLQKTRSRITSNTLKVKYFDLNVSNVCIYNSSI